MPCSRKETLVKLFSNLSTALKFFFFIFYLFSVCIVKLFTYFLRRDDDEYDDSLLYEEDDDEQEEEIEYEEDDDDEIAEMPELEEDLRYTHVERDDHFVADIEDDGDDLTFSIHENNLHQTEHDNIMHQHCNSYGNVFEDPVENFDDSSFYVEDCNSNSDLEEDHSCEDVVDDNYDEMVKAEYTTRSESCSSSKQENYDRGKNDNNTSDDDRFLKLKSRFYHLDNHQSIDENIPQTFQVGTKSEKCGSELKGNIFDHCENDEKEIKVVKEETNFGCDEKFLIFEPPKSEATKPTLVNKQNETFEDTYTIGSTSKSSSEWRSSIRDSGTDLDPFSSSSRRSCPKWESYTVYQKYDEEMMYLDRISAQKLHETESLKSILVQPRSVSERIVHKLSTKQKSSNKKYKSSYKELEVAYVAQICLAWEALNWNYANFRRKQASRRENDPGCPAYIAQQFQQFQVLLQRYVESEPFERGRRPEVYARLRSSVAPKLLQVPEYHDYEEEDKKEEALNERIASSSFLSILEESTRTFEDFLRADRRTQCQVLTALFKRRGRETVDATQLQVVKKHNQKMKVKLKELQGGSLCFKKKKLTKEEEMELLMSLIDLKVVSRVLRMKDLTPEQLQWCHDKMGKLRLFDGKLHRDSSPLFFPAQ